MQKNPILDVRLAEVMRWEIALPLQVLHIFTVGGFLRAWANPDNHPTIAQVFQSPEQARHAASVCAAWLGVRSAFIPTPMPVAQWWTSDKPNHPVAQIAPAVTTALHQMD